MIKIEETEVYGWETAIRGMRNPMNSWKSSDSCKCVPNDCLMVVKGNNPAISCNDGKYCICLGLSDMALMKKLVRAGSDHSKFMRMITVTCDITAPLYWWKEFDTYKVGTVRNSCSTMHKIHEKEFSLDDFSYEHLFNEESGEIAWGDTVSETVLEVVVDALNVYRNKYISTKNKKYWWQMIQLLPSSYNQRATVQLNYQVLQSMYHARKSHKLDEWRDLCKWIEDLPYSDLITGGNENE